MPFSLTPEQVEQLKKWLPSIDSKENKDWYNLTMQAVNEYNRVFRDSGFAEGKGLSPKDTMFEAFRLNVYELWAVANPYLNEINVYRAQDTLNHAEYAEKVRNHLRLSTEAAEWVQKVCEPARKLQRKPTLLDSLMEALRRQKLYSAIALLRREGCVEAAEIYEQLIADWSSFMEKVRYTVFPIDG